MDAASTTGVVSDFVSVDTGFSVQPMKTNKQKRKVKFFIKSTMAKQVNILTNFASNQEVKPEHFREHSDHHHIKKRTRAISKKKTPLGLFRGDTRYRRKSERW